MDVKVMIVDDEPDVLNSLKTILEHNKYDVITANNGSDCLKKLEEGFKGIIYLDIMMPDMSGWETIKEIIKKGYIKNVAINIVTGVGTKDEQNLGVLEPYIHDYITKPVNINELLQSVENCNMFLKAKNK